MPKHRSAAPVMPLPAGWEESKAADGKTYYIDHNTKKTSWIDPRDRIIKPKTFADCIGPELPLGWEECYDDVIGTYYTDHSNESNQFEDPRQQWHQQQQDMLKDYVTRGEIEMEEQHKILSIKQRRLHLAQEKVEYLTTELEEASQSVNATMTGGKYNADQLKDDIANARERVENLKRELEVASDDVRCQQKGIDKLEEINHMVAENGPYQIDVAHQKLSEMKDVREKLLQGEQEKIRILQDLLKQRDEYQINEKISLTSGAGSQTSLNSVGSSGAMTPLTTSEENLMLGMNKKQLRKDYRLAVQRVSELHSSLEYYDHLIAESVNGPEQRRVMLNNEREALLAEIERFEMYIRTEEDRIHLEYEKEMLIRDLLSAREISNKVIEDRMLLENERTQLKEQLAQKTRQTNLLESKLKSLSSSTLSVSSTSSRGSISASSRGSLSASSRGSLNSINYYPGENPVLSNEHLNHAPYCNHPSSSCPPIYESHILATKAETTEGLATTNGYHYPPQNNTRPTTHDTRPNNRDINSMSPPSQQYNDILQNNIQNRKYSGNQSSQQAMHGGSTERLYNGEEGTSYLSYSSIPLNSYQYTLGSANDIQRNSVYSAQSTESVATDSGVFEASGGHKTSVTRQDSGHSSGIYSNEENIETAQLRVALDYRTRDNKLIVSIEKARNIKSLCFQELDYVYVKGRLLPHTTSNSKLKFKSRRSNQIERPLFNEQFLFKLERNQLLNKTLQLDIYGVLADTKKEHCMGSGQISLADFDSQQTISMKWYNLLSSSFMKNSLSNNNIERSVSSVSLESVQQRLESLPRMIADANSLDHSMHYRMRSNSWQENLSVNSQNSASSSSINGSIERLPMASPHHHHLNMMTHHERSKSEEAEHQQSDINVGRSVSDCTGCRRSFRVPFERMVAGRRSVRQNSIRHKAYTNNQYQYSSPIEKRRNPVTKTTPAKPQPMTSVDLEMELQAAYSKQEMLSEQIGRLKEIKVFIDENIQEGRSNLPQWLLENGQNFDALLDEAKKEMSVHLAGNSSFLDSSKKYEHLSKTDPKKANVIGFQDKMRFFTENKTKVPTNPEVHWV